MGNVEEDRAFSLILRQLAKLKKGERLKLGISLNEINEKHPALSRTAFLMLADRADPSFIIAKSPEAVEPLRKQLLRYYGKRAKVAVVEPEPERTHAIRKLKLGHHILVDKNPRVSAAMRHSLANGKVLMLIGKRSEQVKVHNPKNTARVSSVEHAADLIFQAHELQDTS